MSTKRSYPETYQRFRHRAPRVATLPDGRTVLLSEPGFECGHEVRLHVLTEPVRAHEGLPESVTLVGAHDAVFACSDKAPVSAGIWADPTGRLWLAWSGAETISIRRTGARMTDVADIARASAWDVVAEDVFVGAGPGATVWLGSGVLAAAAAWPSAVEEPDLVLGLLESPTGRVAVVRVCGETAEQVDVHTHPLNHSPSIAVAGDGRIHAVWDTEDLRILHQVIEPDEFSDGAAVTRDAFLVWTGCHDPDVACSGDQVVVAYTGHMQHIKYGWFDGHEWQRDRHLSTLHPRFRETLEFSPWFWRDAHGVVHLSFVCLTRRLVYDSRWLGDAFSDPQPFEGLFHPSLFNDEVRVRPDRMTLARDGGSVMLSSTFLPERHGVYARDVQDAELRPGEPLLFLDMDEVAECHGLTACLETMPTAPAGPVFEPTDRAGDFDSARVLNGGTVLHEDGRYRMWYGAMALGTRERGNWYDYVYVGYAESDDGLLWRRTPTGTDAEFAGKPVPNLVEGVDHNAAIFADPADEAERRYKAIKFETRAQRFDRVQATGELGYLGLPRRAWLSTSPDGLRWTREEVTVDFPGPEPYGFTPQKALYDPLDSDPERRYKAIGWCSLIGRRRCATLAYSADCRHWVVAERSPLLDSVAAVTPIRPSGPCFQIHDVTMYRYGRYLLAFYGHQFGGQTADIRLAVSRDGDRFHFVFPETPLIARGAPGEWNSGYFEPADLVVDGDGMALFYGAHGVPADGAELNVMHWRICAGRAAARRDAFVRLSPRDDAECATLLTVPLSLDADAVAHLTVNARLTSRSELRCALVDPNSSAQELSGYELSACQPLSGDSVEHVVTWRQRQTVPAGCAPFRLRLQLRGTPADALYSVTFRPCG